MDTIVHCAAITYAPVFFDIPEVTTEVNVIGTLNFLKCHRLFKKFIYFSTAHTYGQQDKFPITEDAIQNPIDPYSAGKVMCEQLVRIYAKNYGFDYIILRPFNNYGPRQSRRFLIPTLIEQAKHGNIELYGNTVRDMVYVEDTVSAVMALLDKDVKNDTFNISGRTHGWSVLDIARLVFQMVSGHPAEDDHDILLKETNRVADIPTLVGSYEKLERATGWSPQFDLFSGLGKTISFYGKRDDPLIEKDPMGSTATKMSSTVDHGWWSNTI